MPVVDIPFPKTSQPGFKPGEGLGRLLNRYFDVDGEVLCHKLCPGLVAFADTLIAGPRGMIDVNGTLYEARSGKALTVTSGGAVTLLTGTLNGTLRVSWAKNNASPVILACVTETGAFQVTSTTVSAYPDTLLPQPNSVCCLDGYLLFTIGDGRVFASGINDIWVNDGDHTQNALSFIMCDQSGGLLRGTVWAEQFFAWGAKACTVFSNQALSPFPLQRVGIIPVGLIGQWAVTGFEPGWGYAQYFVASDNTVRRLDGYTATPVSNRDVERAIAAVSDKSLIEMSCYVVGGRPTVVVQGPTFTWELNAQSGNWNERESPTLTRWRASCSVYFSGKWLYGDTSSTRIVQVTDTEYDELGVSFTARLESGPLKQFASRIRMNWAAFDFTSGQGTIGGTTDSQFPTVSISTSKDGGATWSTPVLRRSIGEEGNYKLIVRVPRLGGISTQHGFRVRLDTSSPVHSEFRGARCSVTLLGAP